MGKSRIAVGVGQFLDIEVISCDSMQIYRGLDVGTAKIAESEMMGIPHHMIDICDPDQPFSVSDYQKIVIPLVKEINERGKIPVLVGGTGLYYQVVVDDYQLYPIKAAPEVRRALNEEAELRGNQFLHQRLSSLDPQAAAKISPNDRKRIIRALEVIQVTGRPFSALQKRNPGRYHLAVAGISMPAPCCMSIWTVEWILCWKGAYSKRCRDCWPGDMDPDLTPCRPWATPKLSAICKVICPGRKLLLRSNAIPGDTPNAS